MDRDFHAEARPIVTALRGKRLFAYAIDLESAIASEATPTALRDLLLAVAGDGRSGDAGRHAADLAGSIDRALD